MKLKKRRIPVNITEAYLKEIEMRDFMGRITDPEELAIAKKHGLLKWNDIVQGWRTKRETLSS